MDRGQGQAPTPAEVEAWRARRKQFLEKMRAQMAEDKRKSEEHLAHTEKLIKMNEALSVTLKALDRKIDAVWAQCGITPGQDEGKNPFLLLERIAPKAFSGMSTWAKKARQGAISELNLLGFDYTAMGKKSSKKKSGTGGLGPTIASTAANKSNGLAEYQPKKPMRRVRA
ncbi:MAG: hypothetical protein LBS87_02690 [Puniceicoccales bacterium]|jgi:hypothetical protein|nr:hypothetical protein [Puniceicoccales bacterium]